MNYQELAQREVTGYWHTIVSTLGQRGVLKARPQQGGVVYPQAIGILDKDCAYFVLDMLRLAGVPREKWLDRDLWRQWRAALSGRRVAVADGYGLCVIVARTPGLPTAKRLPAVIPLDLGDLPDRAYHVHLGDGKKGPVFLDLAGKHRAILTGGTSGSGKSTMMKSIILQLAQKHTASEVMFAICDLKEVDFRDPFDRLPHLFAPIAYSLDDAGRLIESVEQERLRRAAVMAQAGVADWRRLDEPFPLLLLVVDEAADLAKTPVMTTLIEVARKGRAMGIAILLGTQSPTSEVIDHQVRANLPTAIAFQTRTDIESRVILGKRGAEALDRKGLALAFLDGRWQKIQTLFVDTDDDSGTGAELADLVSAPQAPALEPVEVDLVRYAVEDLGGCFIINRLAEHFAGQVSRRQIVKLGKKWELRGWLTAPKHATDPRRVSAELAALTLPPTQGTPGGHTVTGETGGHRDPEPVTGTGNRAAGQVIGAMTGGFPIPTYY